MTQEEREEKVVVSTAEVHGAIEDFDRQRARTRRQRNQVPIEEIRRTVEDLDRQNARNRAQRKRQRSPLPAAPPSRSTTVSTAINVPQEKKIKVPLDEIRRAIDDLDHRRAASKVQRGQHRPRTPVIPAPVTATPSDDGVPRVSKVRVPLDEIRRTMEDIERQRADAQVRRSQESPTEIFPIARVDRSGPNPGGLVARVSSHQALGALHDLDQQHSEGPGGVIPEIAPPAVAAAWPEPFGAPFPEVRSTAIERDRQRWLDRQRQRSEAAQRRASRRPAQQARRQSEDRSVSGNSADPKLPASIPAVRRARRPRQPAPQMADMNPVPQPLITPLRTGSLHNTPLPPSEKKRRLMPEIIQLQRASIHAFLEQLDVCFSQKEEASRTRSWCREIPLPLQVETPMSFYRALTDEGTMPVSHCAFCYRMAPACRLKPIQWKACPIPSLLRAARTIQHCYRCLPSQGRSDVTVCSDCHASFGKGKLPKACSVNNMDIGCEHQYPEELDDLTPVEEKLIALQSAFGYITKFTVDRKTRSGINYRKHIKGHIVVFPNSVDDLVAKVLPHPLLRTIENIHVSWSGVSKPEPSDVEYLLQVRKSRIKAALSWLQRNNPLYKHITIDHDEMASWRYVEGSGVPAVVMESMQREEPSTVERTATDHIVPDTDRGLEDRGFTSIEDLLASLTGDSINQPHPAGDSTGSPTRRQPVEPSAHTLADAPADPAADTVYENVSSAMFPIGGPAAFEDADKLSFLVDAMQKAEDQNPKQTEEHHIGVQTAGCQPFIRVEHGAEFADNLHTDFFPRTFPTLFPWGKGGPKARLKHDNDLAEPAYNHSLSYWARYVLQRHGGRFATHPVFCFLIFNTLLRSSNRRISMLRMSRRSFEKVEEVCASLTEGRLRRAMEEMRQTGSTTDQNIMMLLRELFVFGHAQPLSNESRLLMRRKIQALCIRIGMPAIWFTINPNDINNPVKMKLAMHRLHDHGKAKELLADMQQRYDRIALSTMDPISSALFFHREVSLFFEKYVRTDEESIFGKISHYYATVETNERGSLHLHGLMWLQGNLGLPSLIDDMADPDEFEYRASVIRYVDSVFHEHLDEKAGKATRQDRKPIHPVAEMMDNSDILTESFDNESNYIAYCCQVHSHTYTCIKYSVQGLTEGGVNATRRTTCRFKAPWKTVERTGFTTDGLLEIRRNHPLVNRYNKAMAVGLRHNHDISPILTNTKGLAMIYYITNYATKLHTPMWKRLAFAADVLQRRYNSGASVQLPPNATSDDNQNDNHRSTVRNETRQFLMRVANRIFSERELSAVEVCYHLLGHPTDFTNVPNWSFLHLNTLYWAIFRRWPHLRRLAGLGSDTEEPPETVNLREQGRTLSYFEAYPYRGALLAHLCLYDYLSMIHLVPRKDRDDDEFHISLDRLSPDVRNWIQKLRRPHEYAVPIFQGFISDDHKDDDPDYFKRNSILHLALFVPWESFLSSTNEDITDIWFHHQTVLPPRLLFSVSNISLLRKSAEDARRDARLWANRSEGEDSVDANFPLPDAFDGEPPVATAEHHQTYVAVIQTLQNAIHNSDATRDSPVLRGLVRDLRQESLPDEGRPLVQRHEGFYPQIRRNQNSPLSHHPTPSPEDIQAAARAQHMLHLRMLDEMETGPQGDTNPRINTDIDDILDRHHDAEIVPPCLNEDPVTRVSRMTIDVGQTSSFVELGRRAAAHYTLNHLQDMALQLICRSLDKYIANPEAAGQHLQYIGGPGGTGKSRIIDALKHVFAVRDQQHFLQITGSSGSAAAQIGGTTVHSACGLDTHRSSNEQLPRFSEAKKWAWKQKLVFVIDEISMLGGATFFKTHCHLQALRDCSDKPFGGIPIVLLMGDFYQFAPVLETSLLVDQTQDLSSIASLGQRSIAHHRGYSLWLLFTTVILLEEQVRAGGDPELVALLNRVRAGTQTVQDHNLLNTKLVDRSQITFKDGLRAITPLNRNRWTLNMEAIVDWARFHQKHISVFVSTHTWRSAALSQDEIAQTIGQGDDSHCKIPGIFFYAKGMPLVVNQNIYTGLKVVNGAEFTAVDIIPDPKYPGYHLADDVTIHFGPPLGILLQSNETKDVTIPSLPTGMILIRPIAFSLSPIDRHFKFLSAKCTRKGLPAVAAFVITDYKAQSKTFPQVLLELRGNRVINGQPSKCDFTSLYVQLSRCRTLEGIKLLSPVRTQDFIGNKLDQKILEAMQRLTHLAAETRRTFEAQQSQP
ncbi:hypothetical protein FOMA001_g19195 [Fusarium oxysporum f. sp. matthiolae]|nr:hypothetical protein FOMA001_g19195 [Fusarium oxysporum f. sp. matthiolae]